MTMPETIYLDSAASTPIAPEVLETVVEALRYVGNPGAAHAAGHEAARAVERARDEVAKLLRVGTASVVFTGSATEANNLALRGLRTNGIRTGLITTTAEHPSVLATVDGLSHGRPTTRVPVSADGVVDLDALSVAINDKTALVSVHAANNETGVIQPLEQVAALAHDHGALVHADASQVMVWGEAPMLDECDLVTVSSHKMHGPQGAAALIVKAPARDALGAQLTGGGQERGLRSGTANVAAIAGFGAAARLARETGADAAKQTQILRGKLLVGLSDRIPDLVDHGAAVGRRLPGILNIAVGTSQPDSVESEALLARIPELAASTGSACHSGAPGPSPVLLAMGVSEWEAARSIRLSLSRYSTAADVSRAIAALSDGYTDLMRLIGADLSEVRYAR
jgi:cysteine desulfurase